MAGPGLWSLVVRVVDEGLTAQTSIWLGPEGVEEPLAGFFADLADDWRGWSGTKEWNGMEGGLRLFCTHDKVGHVTMRVSLSSHSGTGWKLTSTCRWRLGNSTTLRPRCGACSRSDCSCLGQRSGVSPERRLEEAPPNDCDGGDAHTVQDFFAGSSRI